MKKVEAPRHLNMAAAAASDALREGVLAAVLEDRLPELMNELSLLAEARMRPRNSGEGLPGLEQRRTGQMQARERGDVICLAYCCQPTWT